MEKIKTRIRFGFKSKNQTPLFMIWKEYIKNGEIIYGKVIFDIWLKKDKEKYF